MNMSMDGDKRMDELSRAFQRTVRGVVYVVRVLCAVLCVVLRVWCIVCGNLWVVWGVCGGTKRESYLRGAIGI